MESSIAGMLILGVLIVAVVLMSQAYVASNTILGTAMVESVRLADERSRTEFSIDSVVISQDTMTVTATNTGSVPITNYEEMDIFVGSQRLEYTTSTPVEGEWTVSDQAIWSPGKQRDIEIHASAVAQGATVMVSSPIGSAKAVPTPAPTPTPTPTPTPNQVTISCNNPPTVTATTTGIVVTCP